IVDERIERLLHVAPRALREAEACARARLALAADDVSDAFDLFRYSLVGRNNVVERISDLAYDTFFIARQAHREVACAHRLKRIQQKLQTAFAIGVSVCCECRPIRE